MIRLSRIQLCCVISCKFLSETLVLWLWKVNTTYFEGYEDWGVEEGPESREKTKAKTARSPQMQDPNLPSHVLGAHEPEKGRAAGQANITANPLHTPGGALDHRRTSQDWRLALRIDVTPFPASTVHWRHPSVLLSARMLEAGWPEPQADIENGWACVVSVCSDR